MTKKIKIDPGHGGHDSGAVANGFFEKDINLKISKYMKEFLDDRYTGHETSLTRTTDVFIPLSKRADIANDSDVDVFISNHTNAGGGTGFESFIYTSIGANTVRLQNLVNAEALKVANRYGLGSHGDDSRQGNFAVIRETNMPAILTEIGFIDHPKDSELLKKDVFLKEMAGAYAVGIANYLNLPTKNNITVNPAKVADPVSTKTSFPEALEWVKKNGISDGSDPKGQPTREQMWAMLYNYHLFVESQKPDMEADPFPVHEDAINWARQKGVSDGSRPLVDATRQQVIQMLYNDNKRKGSLL